MPSSESNIGERKTGVLFFKHIVRKIFLEDWVTKLVALAITLALWVGVTGLSTPTTRRMADIPLTLSYSNNTEITNSPLQNVSLVISGDKRKVNQISESGLVVSLDLSDVPPGDRVVQLTPENVSIDLPLGVKLQEIQPNKIAVRLETVEEKEVPIAVETQGDVPEGFEVYGETAVPAKVKVRGPSGFLKTLSSISTDKVDITGKNGDFAAKQVPISVSNSKTTLLETVVDVVIKIGEKRIEKTYSVPVAEGHQKRASVTLFGGKTIFDGITAKDLKVEVDGGEPRLILPAQLEGKAEVRKLKLN